MNRTRIAARSSAFAAGIFLLEGTSSVVHAKILRDIPPDLLAQGVDLAWMLTRDLWLSAAGGIVFACGALLLRAGASPATRAWQALGLGVAFALVLEGLNWIIPNSLLAPASPLQGVMAWTYFVGGPLVAVWLADRDRVSPDAMDSRSHS